MAKYAVLIASKGSDLDHLFEVPGFGKFARLSVAKGLEYLPVFDDLDEAEAFSEKQADINAQNAYYVVKLETLFVTTEVRRSEI